MGRICPGCGEENTEFIMGLCGDCYSRKEEIIKVPDIMAFDLCPRCENIKNGGRWKKIDRDRFISQIIEKKVRVIDQVEDAEISIDYLTEDRWITQLKIKLRGVLAGKPFEKIVHTEVRFVPRVCETCSRQSGKYYEAIVQLRSERGWLYEDEMTHFLNTVEEIVAKEREKDNQMAFITKWEKRKEGANVYLSKRELGKKISRKLKTEMGCKLTESRSVVGRRDGRDIYRFTFSLRLPRYKRGDIIMVNNSPAVVKTYKKGLDLITGKEIRMKGDERIIGDISSSFKGVIVNFDRSVVEVMGKDGRVIKIRRPAFRISIGEEIDIVETDSGYWALPPGTL